MKLHQLPYGLAILGAMALFSVACDGDETASDYSDEAGATATGEQADDGAAAEASEDEIPTGPMPEEQFNQIKDVWDAQILAVEQSVKTMREVSEQYKDEALGKMIGELDAAVAQVRQKHASLTRQNAYQVATVEIPKLMEAAGEKMNRAMAHMEEVGRRQIPGGG